MKQEADSLWGGSGLRRGHCGRTERVGVSKEHVYEAARMKPTKTYKDFAIMKLMVLNK